MGKSKILDYMCYACWAEPGQHCVKTDGTEYRLFHATRRHTSETGETVVLEEMFDAKIYKGERTPRKPRGYYEQCKEERVECWLPDCKEKNATTCEFCGMCSNPECTLKHGRKKSLQ